MGKPAHTNALTILQQVSRSEEEVLLRAIEWCVVDQIEMVLLLLEFVDPVEVIWHHHQHPIIDLEDIEGPFDDDISFEEFLASLQEQTQIQDLVLKYLNHR